MNTMLFINSDLNKQTWALEVKISRTTKSLNNILRIYLNERFLSLYFSTKCPNAYKIRKFG